MGLFDFLKKPDFHTLLKEWQQNPQGVLLDVRTPEEFSIGHVPGAMNIPVDRISSFSAEKGTALFVYCRSGARSRAAAAALHRAGYQSVTDLGGILSYHGPLEVE